MELVKKNFALLLAAALCLSLTACGGSDDPVEEEWRGSDDIVAGGIITRSTGSVSVLITVDETGASFYLDEPKQVLFDSVSFPMMISDAQERSDGISLAAERAADICSGKKAGDAEAGGIPDHDPTPPRAFPDAY